jgi:hypothetical protein
MGRIDVGVLSDSHVEWRSEVFRGRSAESTRRWTLSFRSSSSRLQGINNEPIYSAVHFAPWRQPPPTTSYPVHGVADRTWRCIPALRDLFASQGLAADSFWLDVP